MICCGRLATDTLHLDALRDALGPDELTSNEISTKELGLDKVIIQLIQNACKNNKLPQPLDLVEMLHHTTSDQSMSISTGLGNEGKRKRDPLDELMTDTLDITNNGAKRRALGQPKAS